MHSATNRLHDTKQRWSRECLGLPGCPMRYEVTDDQAIAVLHQRMSHETELGLLAGSFTIEPRFGSRSLGVDEELQTDK